MIRLNIKVPQYLTFFIFCYRCWFVLIPFLLNLNLIFLNPPSKISSFLPTIFLFPHSPPDPSNTLRSTNRVTCRMPSGNRSTPLPNFSFSFSLLSTSSHLYTASHLCPLISFYSPFVLRVKSCFHQRTNKFPHPVFQLGFSTQEVDKL